MSETDNDGLDKKGNYKIEREDKHVPTCTCNLRLLLLLHWQLRSGRAVVEWREHFVAARVELSVSGVFAVTVARGWVVAPRVT